MDCCNNKQEGNNRQEQDHKGKHRGHMSHMVMMALCCGAPLILLLLLPAIGSVIPGAGAVIGKIIPFLCPLMMLLMLPMMLGKGRENRTGNNRQRNETDNIESR